MWGITPLRKLRGSRHFYDLPVIIFTAMQGEEDEAQAIYGGAQDFGRKPFEPLALVHRTIRQLERRIGRPRHIDAERGHGMDYAALRDAPASRSVL
jgi:two-component system, OmpR family, phosphate regulon response regulator PhoB